MSKIVNIGLFGFGCVGQGLYHALNNSTGFKTTIKTIVVKDKTKERTIAKDLIKFDKNDILNDPEIDVVVELIDDAKEAFSIVSAALKKGKKVVTANKKMLAENLEELLHLQEENNTSLLYEASACGSIPIIRTLEEYFDNEDLEGISGIFNGTTNYILTKTIAENLSYDEALKGAQEKGFAESDPTNDVEGFDPKFKAIILALHAFGVIIKPEEVLNIGITSLSNDDITYAKEKESKIKLTPVITRLTNNKINIIVIPSFVNNSKQLFNVDNEFNGVIVKGKFSGEQFLQGRGAGSFPTGSAVLSDISALSYDYKYEYKKYVQNPSAGYTNDVIVNLYFRYNTAADLEKLQFQSIEQSYQSKNYNYVVGKINLTHLIKHQDLLKKNKSFVALVNETIELGENQSVKTKEKLELAN